MSHPNGCCCQESSLHVPATSGISSHYRNQKLGESHLLAPPLYSRCWFGTDLSLVASLVQNAPTKSIMSRYVAWANFKSSRNRRLVPGSPRDASSQPSWSCFRKPLEFKKLLNSFLYRVTSKTLKFPWFDSSSDLSLVI